MTKLFTLGMTKATKLTSAGKLREATALIKQMLAGASAATAPAPAADDAIEGDYVRLDPARDTKPRKARKARSAGQGRGETLRRIKAGGMPAADTLRPYTPIVPEGAGFAMHRFRNAQGARDYWVYTPAGHTGPLPLVMMLHGCTQTPQDFAAGTGMNALAEEFGCIVAYPAQPSGANANKCWNWFRPEDQARSAGEPAILAGIARAVQKRAEVDPARVYVAGLSAGGAAAAVLGQAYPEIFAAVGVHSGLPVGAARDVPQAFMAMRNGAMGGRVSHPVPMIVFHGDADATVNPRNGSALITQALAPWPKLRTSTERGKKGRGRAFTRTLHHTEEGQTICELWEVEGGTHAWSGGKAAGSHTDPSGPDASRAMLRFFLTHRK